MSRKAKALGGESQGKGKFVRLGGYTRCNILKPFLQFCQGFISAFTSPFSLACYQLLNLIIDLAIRYDIRWKWIHRLADKQIMSGGWKDEQ